MDSMRHNLLEALDEVTRASDPAEKTSARFQVCLKCGSLPVAESKLRYCGNCRSSAYCSKECAQAYWAEHTLRCYSLHRANVKALAKFAEQGGQKKNYYQNFFELLSLGSKQFQV